MPVIEITSWPASEAYLADHKVILPGVEYLKKVDGYISSYSGLVEEDGKTVYLLTVWETLEHYEALKKRPGYPSVLGFNDCIQANGTNKPVSEIVEFIHDFYPALNAPCTELLIFDLKEGKTPQDIYTALDGTAVRIHEVNAQHAPVAYGEALESAGRRVYSVLGWDSAKFHKEVMSEPHFKPWLQKLVDAASLSALVHISLEKH